jgi:hypothetical protein
MLDVIDNDAVILTPVNEDTAKELRAVICPYYVG